MALVPISKETDRMVDHLFSVVSRMQIVNALQDVLYSMTHDEAYTVQDVFEQLTELARKVLRDVQEDVYHPQVSMEIHASVRM